MEQLDLIYPIKTVVIAIIIILIVLNAPCMLNCTAKQISP